MPKERRRYSSESGSTSSSESSRSDDRRVKSLLKKLSKLEKKLLKAKRKNETKAPDGTVLTCDDYFRKQPTFRIWMATEKRLAVDGMDTDKAKLHFCKFAKKWNSGGLKAKYYEQISSTQCDPRNRTSYKWGFVDQMDEVTRMALSTARDTTDTKTHERQWGNVAPGKGSKGGVGSRKGGKGGSSNCSSCAGPWPCRNLDCPKGRPDRSRDRGRDQDPPPRSHQPSSAPREQGGQPSSITLFDE
eukprot:TRINITY_DN2002_c0_g1_i2.p1 TRINITY_DN2002_c0_g1~~TRINITY_DN2002_c0_g1_i2.p1  ORF type:complete len:244 (+),score=44.54 TRINITY_DN2002_c0_g1_i2:55-786(+)